MTQKQKQGKAKLKLLINNTLNKKLDKHLRKS